MSATLAATSCASVAHVSQVPSARASRTVSLGSFSGLKRVSPAAHSPLQALRAKHHAPAAAAPRKTIRASTGAAAAGTGGAGAVTARKVLMMGGTRFIGVYLARMLVKAGHEVTLFTRGKSPVTQQLPGESDADYSEYCARVRHLAGDRRDLDALRAALQGADFDAVYDINGREAFEVEPILAALPNLKQYPRTPSARTPSARTPSAHAATLGLGTPPFPPVTVVSAAIPPPPSPPIYWYIFCSSAGVYLKSDELPHREVSTAARPPSPPHLPAPMRCTSSFRPAASPCLHTLSPTPTCLFSLPRPLSLLRTHLPSLLSPSLTTLSHTPLPMPTNIFPLLFTLSPPLLPIPPHCSIYPFPLCLAQEGAVERHCGRLERRAVVHCRHEDAVDPKSRHKGKLESEAVLAGSGVAWTSIRPVYIYGPLNYNPVEEWFFHRLHAGRPIPVPGSGMQITQLGHVKDLARAFHLALGNEAAYGQVLNVSGARYVTFDRIATACAEAMGAPKPLLVHYNPKDFDFGKSKAFPLRNQHFFTAIEKAEQVLGWKPEYGLVDGLRDSYHLDFSRGVHRAAPNFTTDDMILEKLGVSVTATA
ncbi:unnamed protein product [Closterium sp. NIES-65]|nr:unnamed protein product [Closterium sp. NIES-65]